MSARPGPEIPEALWALMAEIGPKWGTDIGAHAALMQQEFSRLHERAPKDGVVVERDIAYGPHPRHRLDVFRPVDASRSPVILFVHGGAFVRGDRNVTAEIHANIGYYFARHGIVTLNMEYRLAPEAMWPGGAGDVGAAVAWTRESIARYGGDPEKLHLMAASAGCSHIGTWAWDRSVHGDEGPGVAGVIIISGRVRADSRPDDPNAKSVVAYYGADKSRHEARSPVMYAAASPLPLMIAIAQYENPFLDVYCMELAWRVASARGRAPRFVQIPGHNHISMVCHFNTADERLGREILDFIRRPF